MRLVQLLLLARQLLRQLGFHLGTQLAFSVNDLVTEFLNCRSHAIKHVWTILTNTRWRQILAFSNVVHLIRVTSRQVAVQKLIRVEHLRTVLAALHLFGHASRI